jgi:hypothetical protein
MRDNPVYHVEHFPTDERMNRLPAEHLLHRPSQDAPTSESRIVLQVP